jgi:hypothetical protein
MIPHGLVTQQHFASVCQRIVSDIMAMENAYFFFYPVNPAEEGAAGYYRTIVRPMCFMQIQENLDQSRYRTFAEFIADVRQIWENAQLFNKPSHDINKVAVRLSGQFEAMIASLPHPVTDGERGSALQRLVEVRFANYRAHRHGHH